MIGIAGCGRMGAPMLTALRAAGFDARGFDVRAPEEFGGLAPFMTDDPDRFKHGLDTLITVVRDVAQTNEVLFDVQDLTSAPDLRRIIISSTLSPFYVIGLRERINPDVCLIDAPMSGARVAACEARLSFMLGGLPADLDAAQPLFDAMGAHFHRMGTFGSGMLAKVLNNLLAASSTAMTRLVLDWADDVGLDEQALLNLIHTSSGQNWFASGFNEIEFAREGWSEDNTIAIIVKDIESALESAPEGANTDLPRQVQLAIRSLHTRTPKQNKTI